MLALLLFAASAATVPTIDQTLGFRTAMNPKISPDARYVAYVVQQAYWEENAFETDGLQRGNQGALLD
jgi:hypothetical protein